ncbi:hypothetical protein MH117_05245 [Paenibacillus sp. ACRRX]|uniref:hypothetical protein n=1 Tax=Paenibacillus sp. ACRRX TaxID=2918206 RepID=UPI001EF717AF|nr:hypothetical protein [Paenibacillus sp. ACRRX]MCG7406816.1 hypothetical protein [Paenibacillus sp. ACRRX]
MTGGQQQLQQEQPPTQPAGSDIAATINSNIPKSLADLMVQHQVSELEVQMVVRRKGYYPMDTPITNYDPSFIDGVLVGGMATRVQHDSKNQGKHLVLIQHRGNSMTQNVECELDWDDQIQKDGGEFILLPAGDYDFTVT